jgi:hypothetical protein
MTATRSKTTGWPDDNSVEELEGHHSQRLLVEFLDQLDTEHGPVDESLVAKYVEILSRCH